MSSRKPVARPARQRRTSPATRALVVDADRAHGLGREPLRDPLGLVGEERGGLGRAVGLLGPLRHDRRHDLGRHAAHGDLLVQARELVLRARRDGVREDAVVEEREAPLDPVRHAHAVGLGGEQVIAEQRRQLQVGRALEHAHAAELLGEVVAQALERIDSRQGRARVARVERLDAGGRRDARLVREQRIVGRAGVEEEAPPGLAAAAAGRGEVRVHAIEQRRAPGGVGVARAERAHLGLLEEVVAPEQLVGALARRDHRDALLARRLREQVERHAGRADDRASRGGA